MRTTDAMLLLRGRMQLLWWISLLWVSMLLLRRITSLLRLSVDRE
jgi:hypothetical protein